MRQILLGREWDRGRENMLWVSHCLLLLVWTCQGHQLVTLTFQIQLSGKQNFFRPTLSSFKMSFSFYVQPIFISFVCFVLLPVCKRYRIKSRECNSSVSLLFVLIYESCHLADHTAMAKLLKGFSVFVLLLSLCYIANVFDDKQVHL